MGRITVLVSLLLAMMLGTAGADDFEFYLEKHQTCMNKANQAYIQYLIADNGIQTRLMSSLMARVDGELRRQWKALISSLRNVIS